MSKPLAIELFAGLFGWGEGLIAEGYDTIGFDIVNMFAELGIERRPEFNLVLQDVLTLHGRQFRDAALIVASPPCQEYSYMAMPWSRAKAIAAEYRAGVRDVKKLTALFDACFRIQREACEAAGHFIPLVVENVRGACPWVGRAGAKFGSFYLWGDVPALMPAPRRALRAGPPLCDCGHTEYDHDVGADAPCSKCSCINPIYARAIAGQKTSGHVNIRNGHCHTRHLTNQAEHDGVKQGGDWFGKGCESSISRMHGSKSPARKAASAAIAKIPFQLASHIARTWRPIV